MISYSDKKGEGHKPGIVHIWLINILEKHFVVIIKKTTSVMMVFVYNFQTYCQ
jgi:hypothetical protein